MKKIKLILASLAITMLISSCDNDGGDSKLGLQVGAVPNITKIATTDASINLIDVNDGVPINLGFTVDVAQGDVASMDIIGYYKKGADTYKAVLETGVTTFPATFNISQDDLFDAFTELNSASDIEVGDKLIITAELTLVNGNEIKIFKDDGTPNYGQDIANSNLYKVSQTYDVSCPFEDASLFDGNYVVVTDDWEDYVAGDVVPVVYNPADGLYKFRILATNNPFISNAATAYMLVTIDPIDSSVTVISNEDFNYGPLIPVTGTGSVGSCTGDINLSLNFVGYAVSQSFILVKQ